MRHFKFAPIAEESLDGIHDWTLVHFGPLKAQAYTSDLLERCFAVGEGTVVHQSCRAAFIADMRDDLRFTRSGQHHVIFIESGTEVLIVDFVHSKLDIVGRLERLKPAGH